MVSIYLPKDITPTIEKRIENFKRPEHEIRELMNIEYQLRKRKSL